MLNRRQFVLSTTAVLTSFWLPSSVRKGFASEAQAFGYTDVVEKARQLAKHPYVDQRSRIPESWRKLSYDQYRSINFNAEKALWKGEGLFEVQFFHPGFYYGRTVAINVIENGQSHPVPFSTDLFEYRKLNPEKFDRNGLGFAGFRLHFPLHTPQYADEVVVFLGASYFRMVGRDQHYGLSARGLAIDTAHNNGEEFPIFEEFWLEKPEPEATSITLYALLNSKSTTGAYRFIVRPRTDTQVEVRATLFPREEIAKLGISPLTSMFFFGENRTRTFDDFRPEVHDSDGVMIQTGSGEWIWRPLVNRRNLNVSSFFDTNLKGFGLIQRDRDFANYQDLGADYQKRPSLWVRPLEDWGAGHIELVELPTDSETNDNIVSFWVPDKPPPVGKPFEFAYLLNAFINNNSWPPGGYVEATRIGSATRPGVKEKAPEEARLFVIDFNGGDLPSLGREQPVEALVSCSSGKTSTPVTQKNGETQGWRVFFDFYPDGNEPSVMRCFLRLRDQFLTETWNYLWTG